MKKFYLICAMLIVLSTTINAQNEVTTFLGIPVDGSKAEMIQKLKAKGYTQSSINNDVLVGEFNGMDVNIHIVTNNNKVCRIMVCDQNLMSEGNIKIRFNTLCQQFNNNKKYIPAVTSDQSISDDEDISYEISVNQKRYEATYFQMGDGIGTTISEQAESLMKRLVWFLISEYYGKYQIFLFYNNKYNRANGEDL